MFFFWISENIVNAVINKKSFDQLFLANKLARSIRYVTVEA